MGGSNAPLSGPDFAQGVLESEIDEGRPLLGHAFGEAVLLVRGDGELFGMGATCSHYGGPLGEGLQVDCTVRCPWHHARFDIRTGRAVGAPALNPVQCYRLEQREGRVRVLGKKEGGTHKGMEGAGPPSVVVLGGGAAGYACAEMLRQEGYEGHITILSADENPPYDRPNLSKDYLAGNAPEEWIPLRSREFYTERKIELRTGIRVHAVEVRAREVTLAGGQRMSFGALVLATGAEPIRLTIPGADLPHVHTLRSLEDSRAIIAGAKNAKQAVVLGASFIGLEVAAALRTRGLAVRVVAPEPRPLSRVLGTELGQLVQKRHESQGVVFHLERTAHHIQPESVTLSDGSQLAADLVVAGIGVRPALELAEKAGLTLDRGVLVNEFLETSSPGVWAAGDIARWPDALTGQAIRVEHWVVAQRQGQTVARNILGQRKPFRMAPFFWTTQYDLTICYVGHAESWDRLEIEGNLDGADAAVRFIKGGRTLALATVNRDLESLETEAEMEGMLREG